MSNFGSSYQSYGSSGGGGGGSVSQSQMQEVLKQERDRAAVQSVVAKLTSLCFDKCITRPSNSLSRGETNCVNNCAQRYMEASMFTMNRLAASAKQQQ